MKYPSINRDFFVDKKIKKFHVIGMIPNDTNLFEDIPDQNQAIYLQKFTNKLTDGEIFYTTASLVPSNSIENRVLVITTNGSFLSNGSNTYKMILDFTNVKSKREIILQGPLEGQLNICKKSWNAKHFVSYLFRDRILTLTIQLPVIIQKKRDFYLNFQINDSACVEGNGYPLVFQTDPNPQTTQVIGYTTNFYASNGCSTAVNFFGACSLDCSLCKTNFDGLSVFGGDAAFCITNTASGCSQCSNFTDIGPYCIIQTPGYSPPPGEPYYYFGTSEQIASYAEPSEPYQGSGCIDP